MRRVVVTIDLDLPDRSDETLADVEEAVRQAISSPHVGLGPFGSDIEGIRATHHEHRYNATPISTSRSPWVRCSCGAWSSARRVRDGKGPYTATVARGLDTQLRRYFAASGADTTTVQLRTDGAETSSPSPREPDSTAAVDDVLAGRRRP